MLRAMVILDFRISIIRNFKHTYSLFFQKMYEIRLFDSIIFVEIKNLKVTFLKFKRNANLCLNYLKLIQ